MSDSKLWKDMLHLLGESTGGGGALVGVISEMLKRWRIYTFSHDFVVQDWRRQYLSGTIESRTVSHGSYSESLPNYLYSSTSERHDTFVLDVQLVRSASGWTDDGTTVSATGSYELADSTWVYGANCRSTSRSTYESTRAQPHYMAVELSDDASVLWIDIDVDAIERSSSHLEGISIGVFGPGPCDQDSSDSVRLVKDPGGHCQSEGVYPSIDYDFPGYSGTSSAGDLLFDFDCITILDDPEFYLRQDNSGTLEYLIDFPGD